MSFPLPRFLGTAVTALTAPAPAPAAAGAPPATTADAPSSAAPAPNLVELSMRAAAEALAAAASSGDPTRSATLLPRAREPMPIDAPPGGDTSPKRARTTDSAPAAADVAPKEALPSERGPREAPTGAPVAESARRPPGVDARRAPPVDPRRPSPAPPTDPRRDFRVDARAAGARRSYSPARSLSPRRGDKRTRDDLVLRDDLASFKRSRDDLVVRDDLTSFKRTRDEGSGRYNANSRDRDYRDPRDRDNRDPRDRDFRDSRDRAYRGSNASFAHHDPRARDVPAAQPATAVQPAAAQPATTAQPAAAVQPAAAQPVRSGSVNLSLETKVLRIVTDKLSVAPSTMDALMECAPLIMDLILSEAKRRGLTREMEVMVGGGKKLRCFSLMPNASSAVDDQPPQSPPSPPRVSAPATASHVRKQPARPPSTSSGAPTASSKPSSSSKSKPASAKASNPPPATSAPPPPPPPKAVEAPRAHSDSLMDRVLATLLEKSNGQPLRQGDARLDGDLNAQVLATFGSTSSLLVQASREGRVKRVWSAAAGEFIIKFPQHELAEAEAAAAAALASTNAADATQSIALNAEPSSAPPPALLVDESSDVIKADVGDVATARLVQRLRSLCELSADGMVDAAQCEPQGGPLKAILLEHFRSWAAFVRVATRRGLLEQVGSNFIRVRRDAASAIVKKASKGPTAV